MLPFGFLLRRLLGRRRRRNQNYSDDVTYRTVYVNGAPSQPGFNDPPPAYHPQDPAYQQAYYPPQKGYGRRHRCCRRW